MFKEKFSAIQGKIIARIEAPYMVAMDRKFYFGKKYDKYII